MLQILRRYLTILRRIGKDRVVAHIVGNRVVGHLDDGRQFVTTHRVHKIRDSAGIWRWTAGYVLQFENPIRTDWITCHELTGYPRSSQDLAIAEMQSSMAGLVKYAN